LARKGAKNRTHGRKLRSTRTKAGGRVASSGESQSAMIKKLRARARDLEKKLSDALEQQTATSEVPQVISSSPGSLEPVFEAMLENATRICEAKFGTLFRYDDELFQRVAGTGTPPALVEYQRERGQFPPGDGNDVLASNASWCGIRTSPRLGALLTWRG
jgi:hypothetical protein